MKGNWATKRRFAELVLALIKIEGRYWAHKVGSDPYEVRHDDHIEKRCERVMQLIRARLDDICFYGLIDA